MKNRSAQKGFTLIELLVVIGILAILLSIVLIAINPARQFGQANDTKRSSAVTQILNAVGAYHADHAGQLPPGLNAGSTSAMMISNDDTTYPGAGDNIDLCAEIVPDYIPALPVDPETAETVGYDDVADCATVNYDTGYIISVDANGRITVSAPNADITLPIEVTR